MTSSHTALAASLPSSVWNKALRNASRYFAALQKNSFWRYCAAAGGLFCASFALRLAQAIRAPLLTPDGAYYLGVARSLVHGKGFVSPIVWHYLRGVPNALPAAAHDYWMPLNSLSLWLSLRATSSDSQIAALLPSVLLGSLLAPVTFAIALKACRHFGAAVAAGAAICISPQLIVLSASDDSFMLFAIALNASLLAASWGAAGGAARAFLAGTLCGAAYLTRAEGALAAISFVLLWRRGAKDRRRMTRLIGYGIGFLALAAPWWVRNMLTFGAVSGAPIAKTAWLSRYNDLFRLDGADLNARAYLAYAGGMALLIRLHTLAKEIWLLILATGPALLLAPFAFADKTHRSFWLPSLACVGLLILMLAFVFPLPALKGSFWHDLPALCPIIFALGAAGAWKAGSRLGGLAGSRLSAGLASLMVVYCLCMYPIVKPWKSEPSPYVLEAGSLRRALRHGDSPVMSDDCWQLNRAAGVMCAQIPTDGPAAALRVADSLGARKAVVLSSNRARAAWLGAALSSQRFTQEAVIHGRGAQIEIYNIMPRAEADALGRKLTRQGIELDRAGRLADALTCFEQAAALKPGFAPALANLALARWRAGQRDGAYRCALDALAADPGCRTALAIVRARSSGRAPVPLGGASSRPGLRAGSGNPDFKDTGTSNRARAASR
jgi:tetratricopeptide (TPR) repeat protein